MAARITSPFGMRFHPVLHYWKLHDGTDFGAACGTPIRAAYAGRVAERYYNAGYGNRLMIDHGYVGGRYVTTGYNHASRYIVHVGQRVREGADHRLRRHHRVLDRLPPPSDGLDRRSVAQPHDLVLSAHLSARVVAVATIDADKWVA